MRRIHIELNGKDAGEFTIDLNGIVIETCQKTSFLNGRFLHPGTIKLYSQPVFGTLGLKDAYRLKPRIRQITTLIDCVKNNKAAA